VRVAGIIGRTALIDRPGDRREIGAGVDQEALPPIYDLLAGLLWAPISQMKIAAKRTSAPWVGR
jgi:hypothetical protein